MRQQERAAARKEIKAALKSADAQANFEALSAMRAARGKVEKSNAAVSIGATENGHHHGMLKGRGKPDAKRGEPKGTFERHVDTLTPMGSPVEVMFHQTKGWRTRTHKPFHERKIGPGDDTIRFDAPRRAKRSTAKPHQVLEL